MLGNTNQLELLETSIHTYYEYRILLEKMPRRLPWHDRAPGDDLRSRKQR